MPRFEIADPFGMVYRCDTSDPETAARWLAEQTRRFVSTNNVIGEIRLRIWPDFRVDPATGQQVADWPIGFQDWLVPPDQFASKLYEFLIEQDLSVNPDR